MNRLIKITLVLVLFAALCADAQDKKVPFSITGDMGIWYEYYGLDKAPENPSPDFYTPRRPWNLVTYSFDPTISFGNWVIPFNFNFGTSQYNFVTPTTGGKQSLWQFLTNPANNFGISPQIGNTKILLGTQYIKYSDLSTGDLGIFGYGVNLAPGKFRIKLFNGVSQDPVNYMPPSIQYPNGITGAYQRNQWMGQVGMEQEGKYFVGFNFVHSGDIRGSVTSPPLSPPIDPMENMVITFLATATTTNGWYYHAELGQSFHTRNLNDAFSPSPAEDLEPFIRAHTSTDKDNAVMLGIDKKGKDWEIGGKLNYYGAGYYTAGYPYMNNDKIEYLGNTRFNVWKKKINIVASLGERYGNLSHISGPTTTSQLIANINTYLQFTVKFGLNVNFNNFGFNSPGLSGYKSVSNDFSLSPAYTWSNTKMSQMVSCTYTHSQYDETTTSGTSHNNTQTVILMYVPTFFNSKISPDVSLMWFQDKTTAPITQLNLLSATMGMTWKISRKFSTKAQLQYALSTTSPYTADKNLLATGSFDWNIYKKLSWQLAVTGNLYHYGSDLLGSSFFTPYAGNPQYFESTVRTGLQYKF